MQEEFLTSVARIKKKLRLDMDSACVRLTNEMTWRETARDNVKF